MSPTVALWALTWVAIVVLYLCLSAVLREVRLLRGQVARLSASEATATQTISLPARLVDGQDRVVLASDSRCPLCRLTLNRLGELRGRFVVEPVLLTHEPVDAWQDLPTGITPVRDEHAWQAIAHLSPPVLLKVRADGTVTDLHLPANEDDIDRVLLRWNSLAAAPEGMPR